MNLVVGIELLLKLNDCFVALIETRSKRNHNVSLLLQQTLVSVHLLLVLLNLLALAFDLT